MLLLTTEEFAFLTGRTWDSVNWAAWTGKIKTVHIGRARLIPATELPFYEQSQQREPLYL